MMSEKLIVSELLAFLQYQLDVMDEVSITQICTSNFSEEQIRSAKELLFTSLDMGDRMVSHRRDDKGVRNLQDVISLLKVTDPDDVPTFVAKELRKLPPVTFDHVDVTSLLRDIASLRTRMADLELKFEASQDTVADLRKELVALRNISTVTRSPEVYVNSKRGAQVCSPAVCSESAKSDASPPAAAARTVPARRTPPAATAAPAPQPRASSTAVTSPPQRNYAAAASLPAPVQRGNSQKRLERVLPHTAPPKPSGVTDKDGFVQVRRKKKPASRNQCGSAPTGPNHLLRPAVPVTLLYVSRLHNSIKTDDVMDYIKLKTNLLLRVLPLESRHWVSFNSFVVVVPTYKLGTFMEEEFWPKGVSFRRYRGRLPGTPSKKSTTCTS